MLMGACEFAEWESGSSSDEEDSVWRDVLV